MTSDRRGPFGLPVRRLQTAAVVIGFLTVVAAAVVGGAMAVDSVARVDGDRAEGAALLEDGQLDGRLPNPLTNLATELDAEEPAPSPRPSAHKSGTKPDETAGKSKKTAGQDDDRPGTGTGTGNTKNDDTDDENNGDIGEPLTEQSPQVAAQTPVTGFAGMGLIKNLATGFCVDLPDVGVPAAGTAVNQYACAPGAGDNQDFEMVEQFGQVMLRNQKTNYCLDLPGTGTVEPTTVVTAGPCQAGESDNQMFRPEAQGAGYFLIHVKSGLCLDVSDAHHGGDRLGQPLTLFPCSTNDDHIWAIA